MAIVVPKVGDVIDATVFGAPVANELNRLTPLVNAMPIMAGQIIPIPTVSVPSGQTYTVFDRTWTLPASAGGLVGIMAMTCLTAAAAVGDLICLGNGGASVALTQVFNGPTTQVALSPKNASNQCRLYFQLYAWGGANIEVTGAKTYLVVFPVAQILPAAATVFP